MSNFNLEEFNKQFGDGVEIQFKKPNGDSESFFLKPLPTQFIADYAYVESRIPKPRQKGKDRNGKPVMETEEEMMGRLTKEDFSCYGELVKLIKECVKVSVDQSTPNDAIDLFVTRNLKQLIPAFISANSTVDMEDIEKSEIKKFVEEKRVINENKKQQGSEEA